MLELAGRAAGRYHAVRPAGSALPLTVDAAPGSGVVAEQPDSGGLGRPLSGGQLVRTASGTSLGGTSGKADTGPNRNGGEAAAVRTRIGEGPGAKSSDGGAFRGPRGGSRGPLNGLLGSTLEGYRLVRQALAAGAGNSMPLCSRLLRCTSCRAALMQASGMSRPLSAFVPACSPRASSYLLHLCAYLALNYWTSSFFYFEKALVVAQGGCSWLQGQRAGGGLCKRPHTPPRCACRAVPDAASRTAWFAAINSTSAFLILGLQLLATGAPCGVVCWGGLWRCVVVGGVMLQGSGACWCNNLRAGGQCAVDGGVWACQQ
jgi:hypothetical protein